jgi:hypothetical protein
MERQVEAVRENGGDGLIAELVRVEKEGGHAKGHVGCRCGLRFCAKR